MSMENHTPEFQMTQDAENSLPKEGMEFITVDHAYEFYNSYAKVVGFSIRKNTVRKKDGLIRFQQFVCYKEGFHNDFPRKTKAMEQNASKASTSNVERNRGIVRTGCKARMSITRQKDATHFVLSQFIEGHNHALATPSKKHFLNSHRNVSKAKKVLAQHLDEANVPPSQLQNIGCTERDLRNHIRDQRDEQAGLDAVTLYKYFSTQKRKDASFYFSFDKDEEGRMSRCFWADSKSRLAYKSFGDVVVFDTTYNTNKYSLIFAPIMGVNQHDQTILFACAFLSDETTDSFVWFFKQFLQAMPGGPPQTIITDQVPAMTKAIASVLDRTFHRYCIWHIMNKFQEKLGPLNFQKYFKLFNASVYDSDTTEEFEVTWRDALQQSSLHNHDWLRLIYDLRCRWVPAYVNDMFSAGCSSRQRAESGHSFLKKFVDKRHSLMDFVTRFIHAIEYQRHKELKVEWSNFNERPKLKYNFPMEEQMAGIYTKDIFIQFQDQLHKSTACFRTPTSDENIYLVARPWQESSKPRRLVYDMGTNFFRCSCRLFEFKGIPCRHILHSLHLSQAIHLPEQYILKRWTRNAKVGGVWENMGEIDVSDASSNSLLQRRAKLYQIFSTMVDDASLSQAGTEFLRNWMIEGAEKLKQLNLTHDHVGAPTLQNLPVDVNMTDPIPIRAKRCGRRLKSTKEKAIRNGRLCHGCGLRDQSHDKRNCPKLLNRDNINVNDESSDSLVQEDTRLDESDSG